MMLTILSTIILLAVSCANDIHDVEVSLIQKKIEFCEGLTQRVGNPNVAVLEELEAKKSELVTQFKECKQLSSVIKH